MLFAVNWHTRNTSSTADKMIIQHRNMQAVTSSAMYLHNTLASPHKPILCKLLRLTKVRYDRDARNTKVELSELELIMYFLI
jgi:hypothetical protein